MDLLSRDTMMLLQESLEILMPLDANATERTPDKTLDGLKRAEIKGLAFLEAMEKDLAIARMNGKLVPDGFPQKTVIYRLLLGWIRSKKQLLEDSAAAVKLMEAMSLAEEARAEAEGSPGTEEALTVTSAAELVGVGRRVRRSQV